MAITETIRVHTPAGEAALIEKIAAVVGKDPDDFFGVVVLLAKGNYEPDGSQTLHIEISTDAPDGERLAIMLREVLEQVEGEPC